MNKVPHPVFGKRVQQVMKEKGWNMADLSKQVMLSHTSIQKWAKGLTVASGERLKRLSAVTGKPEHWFFMDDDEEQSVPVSQRMLDDKEEALLSLFNQLPEAEKLRLLIHTKGVLQELDLLKSDVFDIIKDIKK
ncbi:helix-turn-helix domain-containing protein [Citrobacter amalonaticus]|uniref:helix-turn-helix domain-containing protein n=1 Tax=Citrobacter amalonaticus TaxID=35703 RepID=UPI002257F304|nr:helix-turn-helix domain-containing protein [Citrobacter amalonaticus]ELN9501816.1 helix-turn-helix domain-containing protein [Citrobacter amalonaticus]ELW9350735.1 helix-turn-helix domain-containing protein [Citrobacter amalonaticus]MCX3397314.1 helix-turn-helix domain-containing protein [Citrobacter amalonaticus]MDQ2176580.1 helix-turn-helix domain-containing protein [Citrobacter amalonaticus]WQJ85286.1 helix-turn-helix domain-containing protein [Citrobacter amalonaticus]